MYDGLGSGFSITRCLGLQVHRQQQQQQQQQQGDNVDTRRTDIRSEAMAKKTMRRSVSAEGVIGDSLSHLGKGRSLGRSGSGGSSRGLQQSYGRRMVGEWK